ncbi:hypothetical protein P3342_011461 [Pyrenophora teres f. teres]|uniref:Uncharacterized protein n=1 Tax=Pyrenophora teres f. teres TaxID=97479 RepID=A0A6S6WBM4_9PLEO|nr:hypothetical protein PTNB85_09587 [Pyrenophora teres f. teres]KAE8831739.1 hypothetical protein HRS9139_05981 [Pyrenophora teres f. teres]KAE8835525.1 hypothetical protein HRS9122_07795 [Pyrenophora teres f. teres]KAE8858425.1 hypothetical protein PTNB29_07640 [Pyrenophora teres f. teres]KAE8861738.1 hypothetical protein PTNB73_07292 [Pyrenophora teres f. teres]
MEPQILVRILGLHNDAELFEYVEQSATLIRKALLVEQVYDIIEGQRYVALERLYATNIHFQTRLPPPDLSKARSGEDYFFVWAHTPEGKKEVKEWRAFHEPVYTHFTVPPLLRALLTRGTRPHRRWFKKKGKLLTPYQQIVLAYIRRVDQKIDTVWDQAELVMRMYYDCHGVILSDAAMYNISVIIAIRVGKNGGMKALVEELIAEMDPPWMPWL